MLEIEIAMLDRHKTLGAGRRVVSYLGFAKDHLICQDGFGHRVRVPRKLFRFVGVLGCETRLEQGRVKVKVNGQWTDLGVLFEDGAGGEVQRETIGEDD